MFSTFVLRCEKAFPGEQARVPTPKSARGDQPIQQTSFQFPPRQPEEHTLLVDSGASVHVMDLTDPKGVYKMLGIEPTASQEAVMK